MIDLLFLLKRRRVSIGDWLSENNIESYKDYESKIDEMLSGKDYYVSGEMLEEIKKYFDLKKSDLKGLKHKKKVLDLGLERDNDENTKE